MAEVSDLQISDANNTGRFPDAMTVQAVNDGARALEGLLARWFRDNSGQTATTGTGAAYVLATASTYPAVTNVSTLVFRAHTGNTGAATLKINALTAKSLRRQGGAALVSGDIQANQMVQAVYNPAADAFDCIGVTA